VSEHDFDPGAVADAELLAGEEEVVPDEERPLLDDDELDLLLAEPADDRVGRLLDQSGDDLGGPGWLDEEADAVATRAEHDDDPLSAEEEAVHYTDDPPSHPDDGYLDR
jgi:hypothetical protein